MSDAARPTVFISHTSTDQPIATALNTAIEELFGKEKLTVEFSTKKEGSGGIRSGEDWFKWIARQVQQSRLALVLLTPASIAKPWIYWEVGAVYGAALAGGTAELRRVRPLAYQLNSADVPSTFRNLQLLHGDQRADVRRLLQDLFNDFSDVVSGTALLDAGERLSSVIDSYLQRVEAGLHNAPLLPTEAAVQEWCMRLDDLRSRNRMSEVEHIHHWMDVAFGTRGDRPDPLDLRLHRRLGELYLSVKRYRQAAEQFELARRLIPRDMFILRSLGQAHLESKDYSAVKKVVEQIEGLDAAAFTHNVERAALKGRWLVEQEQLPQARDVYRQAFEGSPDSYYLADLLGQVQLALGEVEDARAVYRKALAIIRRLPERNLWVEATAATAALAIGDSAEALERLRRVRQYQPTEGNLESIRRGLRRVHESLQLEPGLLAEMEGVLGP